MIDADRTPEFHSLVDRRAAELLAHLREACQLARFRFRVPLMLYVSGRCPIELPHVPSLSCPECGARLSVEIDEWEAADGQPTEGGLTVLCQAEWDAIWSGRDPEIEHRGWQSDWQWTVTRVQRFVRRRVRRID